MIKRINKTIAILLIIIIINANSSMFISFAIDDFQNNNKDTQDKNVEIDIFFEENGKREKEIDINNIDTVLILYTNIKGNGNLKDPIFDFKNSNLNINLLEQSNSIKEIDSLNKMIKLNDIKGIKTINEKIKISFDKKDLIDPMELKKENTIKFKATYIDEKNKEIKIDKDIIINTNWIIKDENKALLEYKTVKYIPYEDKSEQKLIIQGNLKSLANKNVLPIKETNIDVQCTKIANEYPENVMVLARTTLATNNDKYGTNFNNDNWSYDKLTGKININIKNNILNGKVMWNKDNIADEFDIIYMYSSNVYNAIKDANTKIDYLVNSTLNFYGNIITSASKKLSGNENFNVQQGQIVNLEILNEDNIQKGYLYNNKYASEQNKKETNFIRRYNINVTDNKNISEININQKQDYLLDENKIENSTLLGNKNIIFIKKVNIIKSQFIDLLGNDGKIEIFKNDDTLIETINNQNNLFNNEIISIDLEKYNLNEIKIKISKPCKQGNLLIEVEKTFLKDIDYTLEQLQGFKKLKSLVEFNFKNNDTNLIEDNREINVDLIEPVKKIDTFINKDSFSTVTLNQNIDLKVILENDSVDDGLFSNPIIRIKMPKNIETIEIKDKQIYFTEELKIKDVNVQDVSDGTKDIIVYLTGRQTLYNNKMSQGATISLIMDIGIQQYTSTNFSKIKTTVINEDKKEINNEINIKFVAPSGVVATNSMIGHNGNEKLEIFEGEKKEAIVDVNSVEKNLTFNMNIINNYQNQIDNVIIMGRLPFKGNVDIESGKDLESTINIPLVSKIIIQDSLVNFAKIYYSDNEIATQDINLEANNWNQEVTNLESIKSYMIILENYKMNIGEKISFGYQVKLPANLNYNNTAYQNYVVYYRNNLESGIVENKVVAPKIGITTGTEIKLETKLFSETEGQDIKVGDYVNYLLTISNKSSVEANNIILEIETPIEMFYIQESNDNVEKIQDENNQKVKYSIKLNNIEANSIIEKKLKFYIQNVPKVNNEIVIKALVKYQNDKSIETNIIKNKIINVFYIVGVNKNERMDLIKGDIYEYKFDINSTKKDEIRKNTVFSINVPKELEYIKTKVIDNEKNIDLSKNILIENNESILKINIGEVDETYGKSIIVTFKVKGIEDNVNMKDVVIKSTVKGENTNEEIIEDKTIGINNIGVSIIQSCKIPENIEISAGEVFSYDFVVENLSRKDLKNIDFIDILPKELQFKSILVKYKNGNNIYGSGRDEYNNPKTNLYLEPLGKVNVEVKVAARSLSNNVSVLNKAKVICNIKETDNTISKEFESNSYKNLIKLFKNEDVNIDDNNQKPDNIIPTKKIVGTIWEDKNKDGIKDINETKISNIKVMLLDNLTGDVAKDINNKDCIVQTDTNGMYVFNNIKEGNYCVIFLYDSGKYSTTKYRIVNAQENQNSDGIDMTIIFEGKERIAAITETIVLKNENIYDIDLGLIENPKFDLSLNKTIESIVVNNGKNINKHMYNQNVAKIDFEAKYVNNSSMVIEYKIVVKNEGGIAGYVRKIADYLPKELKFNSELNRDWYLDNDGIAYNNSLAKTLIQPGETKEVKLILTKDMNKEDFGTIYNIAEIYEASNEFGLKDIDSKEGNKNSNEDDYSKATVITTIKTGQIYIYITVSVIVILIIGFGILLIKKKVLK